MRFTLLSSLSSHQTTLLCSVVGHCDCQLNMHKSTFNAALVLTELLKKQNELSIYIDLVWWLKLQINSWLLLCWLILIIKSCYWTEGQNKTQVEQTYRFFFEFLFSRFEENWILGIKDPKRLLFILNQID